MSNNSINNRITVESKGAVAGIKSFISSFSKLGTGTKDLTGKMSKLYPTIKKNNMAFTNFTKDANRASKSLGGLTKSFSGLNQVIGFFGLYRVSQALIGMIGSAMDMIETANLFSVAMGDVAVETNNTLVEMTKLTGLDLTNVQTAVGTYSSLARSMGMTTKQAQTLSTTSYRLALDLASLYNVDINQALGDLRSGLVGQSETVYKYGIDVTEAALKSEALAQGIDKSVRNMSQGEKMALRYAVMIRQTTLAQGDFARTIEQPANQLRILKERIITLSRSIGNLFIPMLATALPHLNAIVIVLTRIINRLAVLMGAELPEVVNMQSALDGMGSEMSENLDDATASAKKLKGQLMGFDEINLWTPPTESAGAGGGAELGSTEDFELPTFDSMFDNIKTKADEIANLIEEPLKRILTIIGLIGIGFLSWKIANLVLDFLTNPLVGQGLFNTIKNIIGLFMGGQGINGVFLGWTGIITIIIARFIDLYNNSEQFRTGIQRLGDIFNMVFKTIEVVLAPLTGVLGRIAQAFVNLLPQPVKDAILFFMDAFDLDWKDLGLTALGVALMFIPGGQIFGAIILGFELITGLLRGLGGISKETWDKIKNDFSNSLVQIQKFWEEVWRGIGNFFIGIANSILKVFNDWSNSILKQINAVITGINILFSALGINYKIKLFGEVKFEKIKPLYAPPATKPLMMANGGIPDYGQMFIAREAGAELVGGFGSKTAVMNNDQIVEAVSNGVYQAVSSAMQISTAGTQSGQPVVLNIDGKEFARMMLPKMDNETKRMGFKPILVRG